MQTGREPGSVAAETAFDFGALAMGPIAPETMASPSFLSVLSLLTSPPAREPAAEESQEVTQAEPAAHVWSAGGSNEKSPDDEEMGSEAESLSYEEALRRGARVSFAARARPVGAKPRPEHFRNEAARPEPSPTEAGGHPGTVTIRMSKAECAQLRERAAEADLTLSAYVRSCVLEAEALRTQVKQALEELRRPSPLELKTELHAEPRAESPRLRRDSVKARPGPQIDWNLETSAAPRVAPSEDSQGVDSQKPDSQRTPQIVPRRKFRNPLLHAAPDKKPPASERFGTEPGEQRQWWQMRAVGRSLSARA